MKIFLGKHKQEVDNFLHNVMQINYSNKKAFSNHILRWSSNVGQDCVSLDEKSLNMGFAVVSASMSGALGIVFGEVLFSSSRIR